MAMLETIAAQIGAATGEDFVLERERGVGGGCINSARVLEGGGRRYFVKLNDARLLAMFEAEAEGLADLASTGTVRVPAPICHGVAEGQAWLAMECVDMGGSGRALERFGRELAEMHRAGRDYFGWHRDNTIGSTPQVNTPSDDWVAFYRDRRLGFQLDLAMQRGAGGSLRREGERLMADLGAFFSTYKPAPSVLHGDLWSGNYAIDADGVPVMFDPAVYYGDREADLAMTELFGGFSPDFYRAYDEAWPLDAGYPVRKTLYNLYHIINHYNLFGGGYLAQANGMLSSLLSEIR